MQCFADDIIRAKATRLLEEVDGLLSQGLKFLFKFTLCGLRRFQIKWNLKWRKLLGITRDTDEQAGGRNLPEVCAKYSFFSKEDIHNDDEPLISCAISSARTISHTTRPS